MNNSEVVAREFVTRLREILIVQDIESYFSLLQELDKEEVTVTEWRNAVDLYSRLDSGDRTILREFVRMISANNLSTFFAILDGVTSLGTFPKIKLVTEEPMNVTIGGALHEIYLQMDQTSNDLGKIT